MTAVTAAGVTNGTSTATYTIPAQGLDVESVYAAIDTTGAAGAVTAELTITDKSGAVIARQVQSSTVDQGVSGSATWALRLLDESPCPPFGTTFPGLVTTITSPNTLRAYWRLGDAAAPWLDTSGWTGGPTPLNVAGAGGAPTNHVTGALPASQDDGAVQLAGGAGTGQYLHNPSGVVNTGINGAWSIVGWIKPTANAGTWIAGIYNNLSLHLGIAEGWQMTVSWNGGNIVAGLRRAIGGAYISIGQAIPAGVWTFLVGTYDGATLKLYANGSLSSSFADARADTFNPYSNVDLGHIFSDPLLPVGTILGDLDEVAVYGSTLSSTQVAALYAAAQ